MIQIDQLVASNVQVFVGVGSTNNACAPFPGPNLEPRPIFRERVRTVLIFEGNSYQELGPAGIFVIGIGNPFEIKLIPVMRPVFSQVAFVCVLDTIPKWVFGMRQLPGEYIRPVRGVRDYGRVNPEDAGAP